MTRNWNFHYLIWVNNFLKTILLQPGSPHSKKLICTHRNRSSNNPNYYNGLRIYSRKDFEDNKNILLSKNFTYIYWNPQSRDSDLCPLTTKKYIFIIFGSSNSWGDAFYISWNECWSSSFCNCGCPPIHSKIIN